MNRMSFTDLYFAANIILVVLFIGYLPALLFDVDSYPFVQKDNGIHIFLFHSEKKKRKTFI